MVWQTLVPCVVFPLCLYCFLGLKKKVDVLLVNGNWRVSFFSFFCFKREKHTFFFASKKWMQTYEKVCTNLPADFLVTTFRGGGGVRHIIRGTVLGRVTLQDSFPVAWKDNLEIFSLQHQPLGVLLY